MSITFSYNLTFAYNLRIKCLDYIKYSNEMDDNGKSQKFLIIDFQLVVSKSLMYTGMATNISTNVSFSNINDILFANFYHWPISGE